MMISAIYDIIYTRYGHDDSKDKKGRHLFLELKDRNRIKEKYCDKYSRF